MAGNRTVRRAAFVAGFVAFGVGIAAFLVPGLVDLGEGRVLVVALGLLALGAAFVVADGRRRSRVGGVEPPRRERLAPTPVPGDDTKGTLREFLESLPTGTPTDEHLRRGLREAAVALLARYRGLSEADARERVERGTWTDDPVAAAFLRGDAPSRSLFDSLPGPFGSDGEDEVGRTVDELVEISDIGPSTRDRPDARRGETTGDSTPPTGVKAGDRRTNRWRGASAVALSSVGVGLLSGAPAVVLAGVVGVGFAVREWRSSPPEATLSIERELGDDPTPGEATEVELAVTNEGDRVLADVRLIDGVPPGLEVSEGSPRLGAVLRPGETATLTYAVRARRGEHRFDPVLAICRNAGGTRERVRHVEATGDARLECVPPLRATEAPTPLRSGTTPYAGEVATDAGGAGVEFHSRREYRTGDPLDRIDWRHRARTGEFATVQLEEERAASVVLLIDARREAYVSSVPREPPALDRSVEAARRIAPGLLDAGNLVGLAAAGPTDLWIAPGAGTDHRARLADRLALAPALSLRPPEEPVPMMTWERAFRERALRGTQLLFLSPLADAHAAVIARRLDAFGYPVTVLSPDPTVEGTPERTLARIGRTIRLMELREAGVPVVDWGQSESLAAALERFAARRNG